MPSPLVMAGVTLGGQLLANALNIGQQKKLNKESRDFTVNMYNKQRFDALQDRDFENEYNSPVEQMKRLKAAGLNPNLVYGSGTNLESATPRGANPISPDVKAPQIDTNIASNALETYMQVSVQQQQLANMAATENLIKAQTRATLANAGLKEIDLDVANYASGKQEGDSTANMKGFLKAERLSKYQKISADAGTAHQKMLQSMTDTEIQAATKEDTITKAAETITSMRINQAKTQAEKDVLNQRLNILKSEGILKELDVEFAEKLNKRWDAYIIKLLGFLMGNKFGN